LLVNGLWRGKSFSEHERGDSELGQNRATGSKPCSIISLRYTPISDQNLCLTVSLKRQILFTALCGAWGLVGSPSLAATIEPGQGDLSINQGQGFKPIKSRVDANVGDRVMAGPRGTATVVYNDGCKVDVQPGAVTIIAPMSPCAAGAYAQENDYCLNQRSGYCWKPGSLVVPGAIGVMITDIILGTSGHARPASP
jgi:hypothetical protein